MSATLFDVHESAAPIARNGIVAKYQSSTRQKRRIVNNQIRCFRHKPRSVHHYDTGIGLGYGLLCLLSQGVYRRPSSRATLPHLLTGLLPYRPSYGTPRFLHLMSARV